MIKKHLACFDFDGTITFSDSLFPFILFSFGAFRTGVGLFLEIPTLIRFLFGSLGRQEVKERLLTQFFANTDLNTMNKLGHDFALEQLPKMTKKEALDAIGSHKRKGHRLILISASLETYLIPWAKQAGFDDVIASKLSFDSQGKVIGKLEGKNCRAEEKVNRLQELVGPLEHYDITAYGDSRGDQELLRIADQPYYRKFKH